MRRTLMDHRKRLRHLIGMLKDKASLVRAALLFASAPRIAVLRATTHAADAPPEHLVAAVIALGSGHRLAAGACVDALMDRLHGTRSATVALKSLIVLHGAANDGANGVGSFSSTTVLRDQVAFFPSSGGRNFLNLSTFIDDSDPEMSAWVRWFAGVLEQNLTAGRVLGRNKNHKNTIKNEAEEDLIIVRKSNHQLLKEIGSLGNFVEQVGDAPESLHLQRNNLVYEVVRLAGQDYGAAQQELTARVRRLGERIGELVSSESGVLIGELERLEGYRERVALLLVNRKRNDPFWELVGRTKAELVRREDRRLVAVAPPWRDDSGELTRYAARVAGRPEQIFRYASATVVGGSGPASAAWMDKDLMALTVSAAG